MEVEDGVCSRNTASATTLEVVGSGRGVDEVEGTAGTSVVEASVVVGATEVGAGGGIVAEGTGSVTRTALPSMVIVPTATGTPVA